MMRPLVAALVGRRFRREGKAAATAEARHHGDILLAVDRIAHRRGHDRAARFDVRELPAVGRGVGVQETGRVAAEHEPAGGGHHAAIPEVHPRLGPDDAPGDGVPGAQLAARLRRAPVAALLRERVERGQFAEEALHARRIVGFGRNARYGERALDEACWPLRGVDVHHRHVDRRDVHQAGVRVVGHRLPVVRAGLRGIHEPRAAVVVGGGVGDRPAGLRVDPLRPVDEGEVLRRQQLAGGAVEDVEEPVLRRLHQHLAHAPADLEVGEDHLHRRRVVPALARHLLVVPGERTVLDVHRDDRGEKEIVAAAWTAGLPVVGRGVASAEVDELQVGVVGHAVPGSAAAAELPVALRVPGRRGLLEVRLVLGPKRGIARHRVEPPLERAAREVVGRDVAAHAEVGATIADDDDVA
ncbi:MAG: hypothetical protein U1F67_00610, partial [Rubrivivax sp.]